MLSRLMPTKSIRALAAGVNCAVMHHITSACQYGVQRAVSASVGSAAVYVEPVSCGATLSTGFPGGGRVHDFAVLPIADDAEVWIAPAHVAYARQFRLSMLIGMAERLSGMTRCFVSIWDVCCPKYIVTLHHISCKIVKRVLTNRGVPCYNKQARTRVMRAVRQAIRRDVRAVYGASLEN